MEAPPPSVSFQQPLAVRSAASPTVNVSGDGFLQIDLSIQSQASSSSSSSSEGQSRPPSVMAVKQSPLEIRSKRTRKGYSKSRTGCLNCKKARVKCKENRPSCDYCSHRGLRCEWPDMKIIQVRNHAQIPPRESVPAIIPPRQPVSNMLDVRLFNHFIKSSYPTQPVNNDSVWTHEIPAISSEYDFLLHSMLALSASHLVASTPSETSLVCKAMSHRLQAISSLNAAIASGITSFEQGNAMLATCYVLVFQSTMINDGLVEYLSFIRGCVVVGMQMGMRRIKFIFHSIWGDDNVKGMDEALKAMSLLDGETVGKACRSLEKIGPLCKTKGELGIYGLLLGTARALFTSSRDGYMELRKIYGMFSYTMSHEDFRDFTNPTNEVGRILMAHLVALQLIMTRIAMVEKVDRSAKGTSESPQGPPVGTTVRWLSDLHRKISPGFVKYYEWPMFVESEVHEGRILS